MPNLGFQVCPGVIPITSRAIILDFRFRIADWWNRCALSIKMDRSTQELTTGRTP
ncbi:hypothetical protein D1AOALGA4SA_7928 [Olavius algarvensis Delta 1 endosymbiont]|nr:hypothetical protein D1AOALGA4SA_7928 [Olavius algarvensis Delta 1 endosymbiont]